MATIEYVVARAERADPPRLGLQLAFDSETDDADLVLGRNLETSGGLETAVIVSLFTDRRAAADDDVPELDRRGWWADVFADVEGDQIGSRLWLLERSKSTSEAVRRAVEYAEEALAWMLEDGVASSVRARAERIAPHWLALTIEIVRPGETARWMRTWEVHFGAV